VNDFLQQSRGTHPTQLPREQLRDQINPNRQAARRALDNINDRFPNYNNWFGNDFWDRHDYHPPYYNNNIDWWRPATGVALAAWLGWTGTPSYVYYDDSGYFANPYWYSDSGQAIVYPTTTQVTTQVTGDWMPLGVFVLTRADETNVTPKFIFQLVLGKNGAVSGTFYNTSTEETLAVDGAVDMDTQRIAWRVKDKPEAPVFETGLYNLTQADTPVRVTFADGRSQDMVLVRMNDNKK
jgi:hypothetical protein